MRTLATVLFLSGLPHACAAPAVHETDPGAARRVAVERVLDAWHAAASHADGAAYFGAFDPGAIFLGTDATERWALDEFRAFAQPYFSAGRGWTYEPRERHVFVHGDLAWFDERLWNDKYGDCRGTGVLQFDAGTWRLVHYSLTLLIPNERAEQVVQVVRGG